MTDLQAALAARNRADRKDVTFRLLLAVPATLMGFGFANVLFLPLIYVLWTFGLSPGLWIMLGLLNAALITFIVIDLKRHPEEQWYRPEYTQADGSVKGHEFGFSDDPGVNAYFEHSVKGGAFSGMPLMTNMSDPRNLATRGRAISSGFANLILGGPRSVAKALATRRQVAVRSSRRTVSSAERFTIWLKGKGVVAESDVKAHLEAHPDQAEGLRLARELEIVTRRRVQAEFHYHVR
jgi:hypothetical protein